ncbi:carbohydrate binding family 9 domain-containing protein [bacterium]|nr:carbohydrate binding family 9 domain-containing protein [bacterium]
MLTASFVGKPLKIDGLLTEPSWKSVEPTSDFVQREPVEGIEPAQRTEVRILYDHDNLYIGVMCYDSEPEKIIRHELIRDGELVFDDHFMVSLDTYNSQRVAWEFRVNANGAIADAVVTGYKTTNSNWDGVWYASSKVLENGWSTEIVIPFKTLRFPNDEKQVWGVNFSRALQREAFTQYIWTSWRLNDGMTQLSREGKLVGLEHVQSGRQLEFKPYILSGTGKQEEEPDKNDSKYGLDVKYGITSNLTFDVTTHTDFAQIEADKEQINLTRFNLYYPEKRNFFLEGGEIFDFGNGEQLAQVFYSRRIGLTPDRKLVPILAGGKVTGKAGGYELGILSMQTEKMEAFSSTRYDVVRVKKDIFRNSYVGIMATNLTEQNDCRNQAYGMDFTYRSGRFLRNKNIEFGGWYAGTVTPGLSGDNFAGKIALRFPNDLMNGETNFQFVGDNFNPEVGFVRRYGIRKFLQVVSFTPRTSSPFFKKIIITPVNLDYLTDKEGFLLERLNSFTIFGIENTDYDTMGIKLDEHYEYLDKDFNIFNDVTIPKGTYEWWNLEAYLKTTTSRFFSVDTTMEWGDYYDGRRALIQSSLLFNVHRYFQCSTEGTYNKIAFNDHSGFLAREYGTKIRINISPNLTTSTYIQWNNEQNKVHCNFRLRYIPKPGSDLYFVYNGLWDESREYAQLENRATVKIDYLFRF